MRAPGRRLVAGIGLLGLLGSGVLTGCGGSSSPTPASAVSSAAQPSASGLGGGNGETSVAPTSPSSRPTIITTPTPTLRNDETAPEVTGTCPYISAADFRKYEGDRVGRVAVLQSKPVGCRFYFDPDFGDGTRIVGEVLVRTFGTATEAFNAMVGSAKGHPEVQSSTTIGDGAVLFRSTLQGEATWQCIFATGNRVFTVRTRQVNTSADAANLATVVARNVR